MTEHVLQQQKVEINYINSLLDATHKDVGSAENAGATFQPTHKDVGSADDPHGRGKSGKCKEQFSANSRATFPLDSKQQTENETVEIATNIPAIHNAGITDDSLYQLVLVDGLKLAIRLSEITQAVDHSNTIIKDDMLFHNGEQLTVVNLTALISSKNKVLDASTDSKQYLLIQKRKLAIGCQQILEMESIDEDIVCWRNENSQRKWLAGTVKQQGIAILDLASLQQMLGRL